MDVLVIVGAVSPPERLIHRARHIVRIVDETLATEVVAEVRARIPRHVGVVGVEGSSAALTVAARLGSFGFPVTLYADQQVEGMSAGVRRLPISDTGAAMEVSDSLLDLIGGTPLVRLDRIGRDLHVTCSPSSSS